MAAQDFSLLTAFGQPQLAQPVQAFTGGLQAGQQQKMQQQQITGSQQAKAAQFKQKQQEAQAKQEAEKNKAGQEFYGKAAASLSQIQDPAQRQAALRASMQIGQQQGFIEDNEDAAQFAKLMDPNIARAAAAGFGPNQKSPLVQVQTGDKQSEFQKQTDKDEAARIKGAVEEAQNASDIVASLDRFEQIGAATGIASPVQKRVAQIGAFFGNEEAKRASAKFESAEALSNEFAFLATKVLKGSISEREIKLAQQQYPALLNTPEGNRIISQTHKASAQRKIQRSEFLQQYRAQNGTLAGADRQFNQFLKDNPILSESDGKLVVNTDLGNTSQYLNPDFEGSPREEVQQAAPAADSSDADLLKRLGL